MNAYNRILAAVDLTDDSLRVRDRAAAIAANHEAELHIVHVLEPVGPAFAIEVMSPEFEVLQTETEERARRNLVELGGAVGVPAERLHSIAGKPAREIRELARTLDADLVVMGGHGKRGLDVLLGLSTSSGVSHGISCDLLIVRMPD